MKKRFSFALREAGVDDIMEKIHVIGRDNHRSESYCWRYQNGQFILREAAAHAVFFESAESTKQR